MRSNLIINELLTSYQFRQSVWGLVDPSIIFSHKARAVIRDSASIESW